MGFRKAIETASNGLTHLFPRPEVLAEANFSIVGIPDCFFVFTPIFVAEPLFQAFTRVRAFNECKG
jgi:hypothetical protein